MTYSRGRKRDGNEASIVAALRRVGAHVLRCEEFDLLVLWRGHLFMLEVKNAKGRNLPTPTQERLVEEGWPLKIVRSEEEAIAAMGGLHAGVGHDGDRET